LNFSGFISDCFEFGDQRGYIAVFDFHVASNAVGYGKFFSRSHDAVIRVTMKLAM
jgi:hypothetical protein